jgi:hypothetical protein
LKALSPSGIVLAAGLRRKLFLVFDVERRDTVSIVNLLLGLIILFLGRKLFWLFVAIVGFIAGFQFATQYLNIENQLLVWIIALLAGLVGAVLAIGLQRLAAAVVGFFAGGMLTLNILAILGMGTGEFEWLPYLIGGIIGAVIAILLFDWALIVLSSLYGASLIVQSVNLDPTLATVALIGLFIIGVLAQAAVLRDSPREV